MPRIVSFIMLAALLAAPFAGETARAEQRGVGSDARPMSSRVAGTAAPMSWIAPLVDRFLDASQKSADIAPDLLEAISRIEPIYDPTRLEGPESSVGPSVSAGTAAMDNVFADGWKRADPDANISQRVPYLAMAWMRSGPLPCEAFTKARTRAGYERPALTALTTIDCAALLRAATAPADEAAAPIPIVSGWIGVPTFAAPMPGSRLSSAAFWAARRAAIARITDELRMRQVWHGGPQGMSQAMIQR